MKRAPHLIFGCTLAAALLALPIAVAGKEARVTQVIRDVKLMPSGADARPAALNDQVREGIAVRTGDQSRSELTFPDVTISRLGANTIFTFDQGGHSVDLNGGSVLLRVPKNAGGGNIRTNAVSVATTGTTVIVEANRGGRSKLYVLEGGARLSLVKYRGQSRDVRAGQLLDVPAGATTLPMPQNIDLNQLMKTHPLIVGFPPLPSRDLIMAAAQSVLPTNRSTRVNKPAAQESLSGRVSRASRFPVYSPAPVGPNRPTAAGRSRSSGESGRNPDAKWNNEYPADPAERPAKASADKAGHDRHRVRSRRLRLP